MFTKSFARWTKPLLKGVVSAILILLIATQVLAASSCRKVKGKFTLTPITGSECTSGVGVCASGKYSGDFAGTSVFTGSGLIQSVDTPTTGVVILIGDSIFTTNDGTFLTKDAISLSTTGKGDFAEVDTIVGGTGQWLGYSGKFTATGTFTSAGGAGTYSGEVCAP